MTTVGKILVVLHLVLSIMFMAFAGAIYKAQTNWRAKEKQTATALAAANTKIRDMQSESEKLLAEAAQKSAELERDNVRLKGINTSLETSVKTLVADNQQLKKDVDQQRDQSALTTIEAIERRKEADLQREKNNEIFKNRDEHVQKFYETEDQRFELETKYQLLSDKYTHLLNDVKVMKSFLNSKGLPTEPALISSQTTPPPPLDGRITEVLKADRNSKRELVEISIGRDSGLEVSHKLTVYRGGKFLGTIVLTLVEADRAVGYIVREKNVTIQVDDQVTTKI
ncbi:hypothetical protein [Schlesneria paludicola]|uniref:hypothetical protein n=1 Tax=Schlesneria paludicola TaxID=360056 RepID=UPI00029A2AD0|nr:hypothetical protein [Schlesneria paludicola]